MNVDVVELTGNAGWERWGAYVSSHATTVMELPGWARALEEAYRIKSIVFAAVENGKMAGILFLSEIKHSLFGHYLTTAPFGTDGGLLVESAAAEAALLKAARERTIELKADYLVVRGRKELTGFNVDKHYTTALVDLAKDADEAMENLPRKTRNHVRKGIKEGFRFSHGPAERDIFFRLFHQHMRDLGSPGHAADFYARALKNLPDQTHFQIAWDGAEPVAGTLLFIVNKTAMNLQTVSLKKYNPRCANYFLYWNMILFCIEKKCTVLDMGRSLEGSRNLVFKENWAPRIVPLSYNYFLPHGGPVPFLDPRNAKFRLAVGVWKCLPVGLAKILGPRLITGLA